MPKHAPLPIDSVTQPIELHRDRHVVKAARLVLSLQPDVSAETAYALLRIAAREKFPVGTS